MPKNYNICHPQERSFSFPSVNSGSVRLLIESKTPLANSSLLMLGMPSGSSLHCTADDINPSGSTSLQPLDISIDISLSALTLKGVTFHLHTMLIKIHPYVVKEKKDGSRVRGHFAPPVFEMREMRARIGDQMIGWIMKKTPGRCPVKTRE